jgi:hypothetical protein
LELVAIQDKTWQRRLNMPYSYVTHLWTGNQDLIEYQKKFAIQYPVQIDQNNQKARHYQVSQYPTLIVFKNGEELIRFSQFEDAKAIKNKISTLLPE